MEKRLFVTPQYTTAEEMKCVRAKLGLTQKEFAMLINCSKATVERWETKREVHIKFYFNKQDVRELLEKITEYSAEEKRRVETIIYMQMKKYSYLLK